ncbi:MAG: hypothetical protein SGBAC_011303 [Bacillariaceae sp.]
MIYIPTTSPPADDAFVEDETKDVELQASEPSDTTLSGAGNLEGQSGVDIDNEVVEEKTRGFTSKFKTLVTGSLNGTKTPEGISTAPKTFVAGNTEGVEAPTSDSSNGTLNRGENLVDDKSSVNDNFDATDDAIVTSTRRGFASTARTLVVVAGCFFFVAAIVLAFIFGLKKEETPEVTIGVPIFRTLRESNCHP